ncbi:MAG: DNA polymerase III subunit delta [Reyranellaceae bacterium]
MAAVTLFDLHGEAAGGYGLCMKVTPAAADRVVAKPDAKLRAILVYGPDEGLVAERGRKAAQAVCPDLADAFRVVDIPGAALKDDAARLADEIAAIALMGGRRVIRVRPAGEESVAALANALAAAAGDGLVVLEAGDLKKTSKLRKLAEDADNAAAVPCYADEGRALDALVEEVLGQFKLRAASDAIAYLVENLGGDRGVSRKELEKLALYKGSGEGSEVTLADAMAAVGDTAALSLDDVALAAAEGDQKGLDRALDRAFAEGTAAISLLRALSRHFLRLHAARALMQGGADARAAIERLRPPPLFSQRPQLARQLGLWTGPALGEAIGLLTDSELQCKTTGMPDQVIVRRTAMRLANAANVARAKAGGRR